MAIRLQPAVYRPNLNRPAPKVAAGGGAAVTVPTNPADHPPLPVPVPDPRVGADWVKVLTHPFRAIASVFTWAGAVLGFDALGGITPANAATAQAKLDAADKALDASGLKLALPAMFRAVDRRAAKAVTELRPGVEAALSQRAQHAVNLMWPLGGSNLAAFRELMTFDQTFAAADSAAVQKALAGISSIDVQRLSVWDMAHPIKRQAATLMIQRPITWLPGQEPIDVTLRNYLTQIGTVSAMGVPPTP